MSQRASDIDSPVYGRTALSNCAGSGSWRHRTEQAEQLEKVRGLPLPRSFLFAGFLAVAVRGPPRQLLGDHRAARLRRWSQPSHPARLLRRNGRSPRQRGSRLPLSLSCAASCAYALASQLPCARVRPSTALERLVAAQGAWCLRRGAGGWVPGRHGSAYECWAVGWLNTLNLTRSIDERQEARALAARARDVAWAADDTAWQRVLRAISGGRWGRQPTGWTLIRLDAPWQDTPSSERPGWRERAANLGDHFAFAFGYRALTADSFASLSMRRSAAGPSHVLGVTADASIGLVDLDDLHSLPAQEPCQGSSV